MSKSIVSSAHLVSEKSAELSEYEYGLIIASNTFDRWIVRCAAAAGLKDLGPLDVLVLHSINHRDRAKKLADLCFVLNIEDTHTVAYSCRKLVKQGLIKSKIFSRPRQPAGPRASAIGRCAKIAWWTPWKLWVSATRMWVRRRLPCAPSPASMTRPPVPPRPCDSNGLPVNPPQLVCPPCPIF